MFNERSCLPVVLIAFFGPLCGCNMNAVLSDSGADEPLQPGDNALSDFSAPDVNADSPHFQKSVTPRDYLGKVSAWYFGHST